MLTPLTDAEYAALKAIPDITEKLDDASELHMIYEAWYNGDEYNGHLAWKRALEHAADLNEQHYEDHLSFRVVKYCQHYYVVDKKDAKEKLGLDLSAPLPIL
jgi:hypothetical protein